MKRFIKIIFINLSVVSLLFLILEIAIRIMFPEINLFGTSSVLLKDKVYFDSPGLAPNTIGISNGAIKETDSLGFWKYDIDSDSNESKKIN